MVSKMALSLLFSLGSGREYLHIQESVRDLAHSRPHVEELQCGKCITSSDDGRICLTYGANWEAGWEFGQEWYDDPDTVDLKDGEYKLGVDIYSQQNAALALLLDMGKLYYSNSQITVEEFKIMLSTEVYYFYESRRTCIFSYLTLEDFAVLMTVDQAMMQC